MKKFVSTASYNENREPVFDGVCLPVDNFLRFDIQNHFQVGRYAVVGLHNGDGLHHIELNEIADADDVVLVFIGETYEECHDFLVKEIGVLPAHGDDKRGRDT